MMQPIGEAPASPKTGHECELFPLSFDFTHGPSFHRVVVILGTLLPVIDMLSINLLIVLAPHKVDSQS